MNRADISTPADVRDEPIGADPLARLQQTLVDPLRESLAQITGRSVSLRAAPCSYRTRSEFLTLLDDPSCCVALGDSAHREGYFAPSSTLAWPLLDALLGGRNDAVYRPERALTKLERRVLRRAAMRSAGAVRHVLGEAGRFDTQTSDPLAVLAFQTTIFRETGDLRIAIPSQWIRRRFGKNDRREKGSVSRGPLELSVTSDETEITQEELQELSEGDILITDCDIENEVTVRVAGIPRYRARLGAFDRKRAITVLRRIGQDAK